jgi:hypothetical protein
MNRDKVGHYVAELRPVHYEMHVQSGVQVRPLLKQARHAALGATAREVVNENNKRCGGRR